MEKINFSSLSEEIEKKRKDVNARLARKQSGRPSITRQRTRSKGEAEALTRLMLEKKRKAEEAGAFRIINEGKLYFDAY
ncbi:MAG TPA: hypothetical protein VEY51_10840 [Chondromyces sp.]|nr:hypothetical protein [Chondromyces sp.]